MSTIGSHREVLCLSAAQFRRQETMFLAAGFNKVLGKGGAVEFVNARRGITYHPIDENGKPIRRIGDKDGRII